MQTRASSRNEKWQTKSPKHLKLYVGRKEKVQNEIFNQFQYISDISKKGNSSSEHHRKKVSIKDQHFRQQRNPIKLPEFDCDEEKKHFKSALNSEDQAIQNSSENSVSQKVNNSHVPWKTLDYLKLVDEPKMNKTISQFNGHQYQTQFRNPLQKKTLFLDQIKQLSHRNHRQCAPVEGESQLPPDQMEKIRIKTAESAQENDDNITNKYTRQITEENSPLRNLLKNQRALPNTSSIQYRNQSMRATINSRNSKFNATDTGGYGNSFNRRLSVFSNTLESNHQQQKQFDSDGLQQDSIESVVQTKQTPSNQRPRKVERAEQQLLKEFMYYKSNVQTYQPYYKETRNQQEQRKNQLLTQTISLEGENSINFAHLQQRQPGGSQNTRGQIQTPVDSNIVSSVISSALRGRTLNKFQQNRRKGSLQHGTLTQTSRQHPEVFSKIGAPAFFHYKKNQSVSIPPLQIVSEVGRVGIENASIEGDGRRQLQKLNINQKIYQKFREQTTNTVTLNEETQNSIDNTDRQNRQTPDLNPKDVDISIQSNRQQLSLNPSRTSSYKPSVQDQKNQHNKSLGQSQSASKSISIHDPSVLMKPILGLSNQDDTPEKTHSDQGSETIPYKVNTNSNGTDNKNYKKSAFKKKETLKGLIIGDSTLKNQKNTIQIKQILAENIPFEPLTALLPPYPELEQSPRQDTIGLVSQEMSIRNLIESAQNDLTTQMLNNENYASNSYKNQDLKIIDVPSHFDVKNVVFNELPQCRKASSFKEDESILGDEDVENNDQQQFAPRAGANPLYKDQASAYIMDREGSQRGSRGFLEARGYSVEKENSEVLTQRQSQFEQRRRTQQPKNRHKVSQIRQIQDQKRKQVFGNNDVSTPRDYVITQYSLPKALIGTPQTENFSFIQQQKQISQARSISQGRSTRGQWQALVTKVQGTTDQITYDKQKQQKQMDNEQFNFDREDKQLLQGPQGRKLSNQMAKRIQFARQKRKDEEDNRIQMMQDQQLLKQFKEQQKLIQQENINSKPASRQDFEGSVQISPVIVSPSENRKQPAEIKKLFQKQHLQKRVHRINQYIDKPLRASVFSTREDQAAQYDLKSVINEKQITEKSDTQQSVEKKVVPQIVEKPTKVIVPQLKLNKVQLQFDGQNDQKLQNGQRESNQPILQNQHQRNFMNRTFTSPFRAGQFYSSQNQGQQSNRSKNNNDLISSQEHAKHTRMISIDVQTEAKNSKVNYQEKTEKLRVVATQERSLQDTLYDGGAGLDLIGSHNFMMSAVKLVDNSVTEAGGRKNTKLDAEKTERSFLPQEIFTENVGPITKETGQFASLNINLEDNDLVNTGEQELLDRALKLIMKKSTNSADELRASKNRSSPIKNIDIASDSRETAMINETVMGENNSQVTDPQSQGGQNLAFCKEIRPSRPLVEKSKNQSTTEVEQTTNYRPTPSNQSGLSPLSPERFPLNGKYTAAGDDSEQSLMKKHQLKLRPVQAPSKNISAFPTQKNDINQSKIQSSSNRDLNIVVTKVNQKTKIHTPRAKVSYQKSQNRVEPIKKQNNLTSEIENRQNTVLSSNEETPCEDIIKQRLSVESMTNGILITSHEEKMTLTLGGNSSQCNSPENQNLMQKLMSSQQQNESFESSSYMALQVQAPSLVQVDNRQRSSSIGLPNEQLMPRFPNSNPRQKESLQFESEHRESICSVDSSDPSKLRNFNNNYGGQTVDELAMPLYIEKQYATENTWLDRFCQNGKNNEHLLQLKSEASQARRERALAFKTQSGCSKGKPMSREHTPPVSQNRMHLMPAKRLSQCRAGNVGNNNVRVENVWVQKKKIQLQQ